MLLSVPTIACDGCIEAITKALTQADPQAQVQGDRVTKELTIQTQLSATQVRAVIQSAGHEVGA
ncbi:MAG: heavy-metal-associated domain-containing protein [Oscillatoriales cyanobacterium SM2_2_1]|nr:heavy-metal-associated domain-containing protein [Oscillatoriales cyanobacterium SM2_2_1]